jgi:ribosomal protein S18 acetylase RimI-like enzyme
VAFRIEPLTPDRWADLETIFAGKGCSFARTCWCMAYRQSGTRDLPPPGAERTRVNRKRLKALVERGEPPGLIAYDGDVPVGWVSVGPREDYKRLERSSVMRPVDDLPVWSIVCFVVPSEHRSRGVARALLDGAIDFAKRRGARIVEAYPIDKPTRSTDSFMWFGAKSMFDKAGFEEVARRKPERPVVRRRLRVNRKKGS